MALRLSPLLALLLAIGLTACGTSSSSTNNSEAVSSDRIIVEALSDPVSGMSAYDVVSQYRPQWLQKRGATSINNPVDVQVYLDGTGTPYGSVESLRSIQANQIATIEYFNATRAQFRFGLSNTAGALLIKTKTGS